MSRGAIDIEHLLVYRKQITGKYSVLGTIFKFSTASFGNQKIRKLLRIKM